MLRRCHINMGIGEGTKEKGKIEGKGRHLQRRTKRRGIHGRENRRIGEREEEEIDLIGCFVKCVRIC